MEIVACCTLKDTCLVLNKDLMQDFSGGPVGGNLSSNAGVMGSIPGQGTKIPCQGTEIPHAVGKQPRHATRERQRQIYQGGRGEGGQKEMFGPTLH